MLALGLMQNNCLKKDENALDFVEAVIRTLSRGAHFRRQKTESSACLTILSTDSERSRRALSKSITSSQKLAETQEIDNLKVWMVLTLQSPSPGEKNHKSLLWASSTAAISAWKRFFAGNDDFSLPSPVSLLLHSGHTAPLLNCFSFPLFSHIF